MNGELVGEWTSSRSGNPIFRYAKSWLESPRTRPLSLSVPLTEDLEVRGPAIDHYFDNLLPDNADIRDRIRQRFGLRSAGSFELLEAIGRDCVGAVHLLPPGREPQRWDQIDVQPLHEADLERTLRDLGARSPLCLCPDDTDDAVRVSLAGWQEKTALLSMGGAWYRPRNATPTTHILKLPLGVVGNRHRDFSDSIENEWLCARFVGEFALPVADTQMVTFGEQRALIVKRFDRRWVGVDETCLRESGFVPPPGLWIARLPQEDFCQATGRPPTRRYENDGGPSIDEILQILARSENPERDRRYFVLAQLALWLLAATDGHGKNFSIHHRPGGAFSLTPMYDVLSTWPLIGRGIHELPLQDAKLAMAVSTRDRRYAIVDIEARHWHALAHRTGGSALWEQVRDLVESVGAAIECIQGKLPHGFPERVFTKIADGVRAQACKFLDTAARLP
jgi:serine/threonine-protein kinase HipA